MSTADIVAGAIKDAEEGVVPDSEPTESSGSGERTIVDIGGVNEGEESEHPPTETAVSPSSTAATEDTKKDLGTAVAKTTPPPAAQPDNELTKELARHGIHAPKPGAREGVFRWSKVQKVVENVRAKAAAQFEPQIKERDTQIATLSKRLENVDNADRMIFHDPDRYIATLAAMHPEKYGKFAKVLNGGAAQPEPGAKTTPPPTAADDPMPEPDAQFPDGSLGYSLEGQQKREEWLQRRIVADVTAKVEKMYADRVGPIEKDWKQRQMDQAAVDRREKARPGVQSQIATAKKLWGPLFKAKLAGDAEDDPEILKAMDDHPDWSFEACVSSVLLPKMQADRETMRKGLIDEIKQAPLAAAKTTPGSGGGGGTTGTRTTAQIVAEAVRSATGR